MGDWGIRNYSHYISSPTELELGLIKILPILFYNNPSINAMNEAWAELVKAQVELGVIVEA